MAVAAEGATAVEAAEEGVVKTLQQTKTPIKRRAIQGGPLQLMRMVLPVMPVLTITLTGGAHFIVQILLPVVGHQFRQHQDQNQLLRQTMPDLLASLTPYLKINTIL